MKNNSTRQTKAPVKSMKTGNTTAAPLSEDAFYLLALASQLKKLLGPASLQQFLISGKFVVPGRKATA